MLGEAHILGLVNHYLSLHQYPTAIFLCERLHAQSKAAHIVHKLGMCYYRAGQVRSAYALLRSSSEPENRYLYAVCASELNQLEEAERALLSGSSGYLGPLLTQYERECNSRDPVGARNFVQKVMCVPNGAAGLALLGTLCRKANRKEHARICFEMSLLLDPFLWSSFQELCEMGFESHARSFFQAESALIESEPAATENMEAEHMGSTAGLGVDRGTDQAAHRDNLQGMENSSAFKTPAPHGQGKGIQSRDQANFVTPGKSAATAAGGSVHGKTLHASEDGPTAAGSGENAYSGIPTPRNPVGRPRAHRPDRQKAGWMADPVAARALLRLLQTLGDAYWKICQYRCHQALHAFQSLAQNDYRSGWVLHQVARCHFEITDYRRACEVFEQLRKLEPYRMAGMELYSTTLWHLKKEVELSYLAQQLVEYGRHSPEVWCAIGNCFSLQKEHEVALKFFQRAIQLDETYTYAYTLSGHEYVSNEDFEKAIECYRHAIRTNDRHYNAWYGLGTIYYRQEKFRVAEFHFQRALSINPNSSVLHCYLGMVLNAQGHMNKALAVLQKATIAQPANPQAKFTRANVLLKMGLHEEALEQLSAVRDFIPKEASVRFLMGKVCKQLGRTEEAIQHFTTALDLDPKDSNQIKTALDKLDSQGEQDDDAL